MQENKEEITEAEMAEHGYFMTRIIPKEPEPETETEPEKPETKNQENKIIKEETKPEEDIKLLNL